MPSGCDCVPLQASSALASRRGEYELVIARVTDCVILVGTRRAIWYQSCHAAADPIEKLDGLIVRRAAMEKIRAGRTNETQLRVWEPPIVTKIAIGAETKSARPNSDNFPEPPPPSSPGTKLGFSFEMAFPMAARTEK